MEPSSDVAAPILPAPVAATSSDPSDSAFGRFRRQRFFGSLDGLRAISILGVIWHHSAASAFPDATPLVHEGNRGVNLFFGISAFLISTLLLRARERNALDVPRFWIRRALRIMPLYYAMLAGYALLVFGFEHDTATRAGFFSNLPYFATFTSNWFVELDSPRVVFFFAWSLAAEEQFYLCWPWVERTLSRWWPVAVALGALGLTQAARVVYELGGREGLLLKIVSSVPAAILLGVVLAHGLHTRRGFRLAYLVLGRRGAAVAAGGLVVLILWLEPRLGYAGDLLVATALAALVGACVVREDNALAPVLTFRPVAWIGVVSYGIYLMNMLGVGVARSVLKSVLPAPSPALLFVTATIVTVAAASISYLTYERFFLALKDRWFADAPARPTAPASAAVVAVATGAADSTPS